MYDRLNKLLGVDLTNIENVKILLTKYTLPEYITKVLDVRLKHLETKEERMYHFITGVTSEINELNVPLIQLIDCFSFGNIHDKNYDEYDSNLLWNALEELGDYSFFKVGLVEEMGLKIPKLPTSKVSFNILVETINKSLQKVELKPCPKYTNRYGDSIGLYYIAMYICEQLTSLMKKNVISEKSITFESMKPKLEMLIYSLDLIVDYIMRIINDLVMRIYGQLIVSEDVTVMIANKTLVDFGSIYHINDLKLSKRYVGKLTTTESENRDYENEKSMK